MYMLVVRCVSAELSLNGCKGKVEARTNTKIQVYANLKVKYQAIFKIKFKSEKRL